LQVIRLLRRFTEKKGSEPIENSLRIHPKLSLAFPPADIDHIEEKNSEDGIRFKITATPLGLYGTSSPLPTFYTEDLMEEASEDDSVTRDFIDIVNLRMYQLLFRCMIKYNQFLKTIEEKDLHDFERLFCLIGLGETQLREEIKNPQRLIRYIGLFSQSPRSILGLKTLLNDALGKAPINVIPCVFRKAKIPEDQRFSMGQAVGTLGIDTFVGEEIDDRMGKFKIQVGPMDAKTFPKYFPGNDEYDLLILLSRLYVLEPLEFDVELILASGEAMHVCLGQPDWSRLGMDTWLFSGDKMGEAKVTLNPDVLEP
jgi:type VI secretion system protein ImpH